MKAPAISKGTKIRTIALAITMVNAFLMMIGKDILPYNEADVSVAVEWIYKAVSYVAMVIATLAAWWKDNDFTPKARIRKEQMKKLDKK